jgi:energy-coupling factor transporter transmembrane protein EcfT
MIQLSMNLIPSFVSDFGSRVLFAASLLVLVVLSALLFAFWMTEYQGFGFSWISCLIGCSYSGFMFGVGDYFWKVESGEFYETDIVYWTMSLTMVAQLIWYFGRPRLSSTRRIE